MAVLGDGLQRPHRGLKTKTVAVIAVFVARSGTVAGGDGVQSLCGGGDVAQLREHLVALVQQFDGAVAVAAGCAGGGEVVFGALDCGARLGLLGFGGA